MPRRVIWIITDAIAVFLIWALLPSVDEMVRTPGRIVPPLRPQIIQNLEGGILAKISVCEGDIVEWGQVLARLQGIQYQAMIHDLSDHFAALKVRRLRREAGMVGMADRSAGPGLRSGHNA